MTTAIARIARRNPPGVGSTRLRGHPRLPSFSPGRSIHQDPSLNHVRYISNIPLRAEAIMKQIPKWSQATKSQKWILGTAGTVLVLGLGKILTDEPDPLLARPNPADKLALSRLPFFNILKGWIVYAFCSSPTLIELSEGIFNELHKIPIVSWPVDYFARITFFDQFFGGESAEESEHKVWLPLRNAGIGTLCGYNIEANHDGTGETQDVITAQIQETLHSIAAVGAFGIKHCAPIDVANGDTRCWIRTKLTGLTTDPEVLVRASKVILDNRHPSHIYYPGAPQDGDWQAMMSEKLSQPDRSNLEGLYKTMRQIMIQGQKYGVRVIVDGEQTWYQPAIDVFTEELMKEFNSGGKPAIVCATFQAYLRRNADLIKDQMERSRQKGYKLVFKQVRGAYHPYETEQRSKLGKPGPPPVWSTKADTDKSYNTGIAIGLRAIKDKLDNPSAPDVAAIYATHNEHSVEEAVKLVGQLGLGKKQDDGSFLISAFTANRLAFAQIYGMKDNLTNRVASQLKSDSGLPVVCKSVSYGTFEDALPYLSRRAVENKTVMEGRGGASTERKRYAQELGRRLMPFYTK